MSKKIDRSGTAARQPFFYMLRASGQGEVWNDADEEAKFHQYGWRCSTNEENYSAPTLIGNWYEKSFGTGRAKSCRPRTSQFSHYYETTYSSTFTKKPPVNRSFKKEPQSIPDHQPDPPHTCTPGESQTPDCTSVDTIHQKKVLTS
ncbi:DUF1143 domain-containing protein, partial [Listeria monocytogenes]